MLNASSGFKGAIIRSHRKYDIKVQITRNERNSLPIDISDRIISYSTTQDFESRNGRLSVEIDNYDYAFSPSNRNSAPNSNAGVYDPLLDANHKIELFDGVLVNGTFEYVKKFEGYLGDEINASSSPVISLSCRDTSKLMQDAYIYQSASYALYLVEEVIQDLITTFLPRTGITVQVEAPTQYMIGRPDGAYTAKDTNLWDACQLLADAASHELRFMEDGTLVLRRVERDFTSIPANLSLDMTNLISNDLAVSDADVRNHIVIKVQGYDPITKEDDDSIDKYGRRYMEVHRSMSDIITDVSQAHELGENILRDLRFAHPTATAEIPFHPLVQVGDIVEITNPRTGTDKEYDIFKVVSVQSQYSKDRKRTSLTLVGHDKFLSAPSIKTNPITSFTSSIEKRTIQNYPRSGWSGYEKEIFYPKLKWTPPTKDIEGNTLGDNFGGYVIMRGSQLTRSKNEIMTAWRYSAIASIPSYISSLNFKVNHFYDYSCAEELFHYKKIGNTTGYVDLRYRIYAVNKKGEKSKESTLLTVRIPLEKIKDEKGNYM